MKKIFLYSILIFSISSSILGILTLFGQPMMLPYSESQGYKVLRDIQKSLSQDKTDKMIAIKRSEFEILVRYAKVKEEQYYSNLRIKFILSFLVVFTGFLLFLMTIKNLIPKKLNQSSQRTLNRAMQMFENHFSRKHFYVFLYLWMFFTAATCLIVTVWGEPGPGYLRRLSLTTLGTILGPMTGAISRDFQSCCLSFSVSLLPFCLAFLAAGTVAQVIKGLSSRWRMALWTLGLLGWFLGGVLSFGHALD